MADCKNCEESKACVPFFVHDMRTGAENAGTVMAAAADIWHASAGMADTAGPISASTSTT